jgi:methylated-DNA-[protein]-cysteine S-methyltransferase
MGPRRGDLDMTATPERSVRLVQATGRPRTYDTYRSPLGNLLLVAEGRFLVELALEEAVWTDAVDGSWSHDADGLAPLRAELDEYFAGRRRRFSVPVSPSGTPFQLEVWNALTEIPYGSTTSYGSIAAAVARPNASRAIGGANHVNPIPILIPCHRVIGADGSLAGYGGGMERKRLLLDLERATIAKRA